MPPPFPSRAEIEADQLEQLRALVTELFPANAFYTRKLEDCGVTFDVASLADFSRRFPFTTKAELVADQAAHPPFGSNLTYPLAAYTRFHQTSGTTGAPLRWLDTPESWAWLRELWTRVFTAAGVTAADRVCFAFSFGPFLGFWMAFESAQQLGCLCLPTGGMSSAARLRLLLDNGVTTLCCTPTYALRLGEVAREEGLDLGRSRVRRILVAGEPGGSLPAVRARIESLWPDARVRDHHGMTEVGPVTYECPAQPGVLHVMESGHYAEVIAPATGQPVSPGETGELVLTPLGRVASPVLRYRTGDLVRPAAVRAACVCGTHELALAGGILGRTDDMVIVRGVNVHPAAVEEILRAAGGVAEYQVTVTTRGPLAELALAIEPAADAGDATALARKIGGALETALGLRIPVHTVAAGSLPRFELKARRWHRAGK